MSKTNHCQLIGQFGQDPSKIITQEGKILSSFSFATHDARKDATGQYQQITDWHNVVAFGKTAELICQYMTKGSKAMITGKLSTRQYTDKQGHNRFVTEIIVEDILFLSQKQKENNEPNQ
jgi:single-strand DNA-binding protein